MKFKTVKAKNLKIGDIVLYYLFKRPTYNKVIDIRSNSMQKVVIDFENYAINILNPDDELLII